MKRTKGQSRLINKLELAMAHLIFDGEKRLAKALGPMVEWLERGDPVTAVLEGEASGLDERVLDAVRKEFKVLKFS